LIWPLLFRRQGRELRSRAAGTAELQEELGPGSISALQKSYSLSVSFAQVQYHRVRHCICSNLVRCITVIMLHSKRLPVTSRCAIFVPCAAQILSITVADEEVAVSYCHNVASQHNNELHFTLAMPSPEVCHEGRLCRR
jgi:hypothetical protein